MQFFPEKYDVSLLSGKLASWRSLTREEKKFFFLAYGYALMVKFMILILPMRVYASKLGQKNTESPETENSPEQIARLKIVSDAIKRSGKYMPWRNKCMVEAITAKLILNKMGYDTTLYFGVGKDEKSGLIAHAWLRCGNSVVTGNRGKERFTVVSYFT